MTNVVRVVDSFLLLCIKYSQYYVKIIACSDSAA